MTGDERRERRRNAGLCVDCGGDLDRNGIRCIGCCDARRSRRVSRPAYPCAECGAMMRSARRVCVRCRPRCTGCGARTNSHGESHTLCVSCRRARSKEQGALLDSDTPWEQDDRCWYVVTCHPGGLTLDEIGDLFGLTCERIRQIEMAALRKLGRRMHEELAA